MEQKAFVFVFRAWDTDMCTLLRRSVASLRGAFAHAVVAPKMLDAHA
jgi:hypothetical protein